MSRHTTQEHEARRIATTMLSDYNRVLNTTKMEVAFISKWYECDEKTARQALQIFNASVDSKEAFPS